MSLFGEIWFWGVTCSQDSAMSHARGYTPANEVWREEEFFCRSTPFPVSVCGVSPVGSI